MGVREARRLGLALVLDVGLAVALAPAVWSHPSSTTIGRKTDAPYTIWALAWAARAVANGASPFVTRALSWPAHVNLLTNASMIGAGVVTAPVTWLWGPLVTYNVLAVASLALTAWSAQFVLSRTRLISFPAAFTGGLVAGFAPWSVAQTTSAHLHVAGAFLVPPMLLAVGRLATGTARRPGRWGVALGLLAAAQLLIGEEVLAITAITAGIGVAVAAGFARPLDWRGLGRGLAAGVLVFVPLAVWPLWIQFVGPGHIDGHIQVGTQYPTDVVSLVVPHGVWLGSALFPGVIHTFSSEGGVYLGLPIAALCVLTVALGWRSAAVRVAGVTAAVLVVLSLGAHLMAGGVATGFPLPWDAVAHLPLLESLLPARFGLPIDLLGGALLAVAVDAGFAGLSTRRNAGRRKHRRRRPTPLRIVTVLAGAAVCVAPLVPALPLTSSEWGIPAAFRHPSSTGIPAGALVALGPYPSVARPEVEVWLAAAGARWRSPGGSYFIPSQSGKVTIGGTAPAWAVVETAIEEGADPAFEAPEAAPVLSEMRADGVAAVIVGPMARRAEVEAWWSSLLGPPHTTGGATVWMVRGG